MISSSFFTLRMKGEAVCTTKVEPAIAFSIDAASRRSASTISRC
jgi:hypothetical protein